MTVWVCICVLLGVVGGLTVGGGGKGLFGWLCTWRVSSGHISICVGTALHKLVFWEDVLQVLAGLWGCDAVVGLGGTWTLGMGLCFCAGVKLVLLCNSVCVCVFVSGQVLHLCSCAVV